MSNAKKNVLVADDDIDLLEQLKLSLLNDGYNVLTAESQKEAETVVEQNHLDVAILDLMMENPDSGFILSYKIKKKHPECPVIIVTAVSGQTNIHFDAKTREERSWVKADAIIEKGLRYEQLKAEIQRLTKD